MKQVLLFLLVWVYSAFSQSKNQNQLNFKGEHYALYNKCKVAVTFCELTQQDYLSCGSVKNCYGLYVLPGDTFYINIEDKNQAESITADISFTGYFPAITAFTFQPVDFNCLAQGALQVTIPLTATLGSSFQVVAQNIAYTSNTTFTPSVPQPYNVYVGGQQPSNTTSLSNFTTCPIMEDVSAKDIEILSSEIMFYPNPTNRFIYVLNSKYDDYEIEISDIFGQIVLKAPIKSSDKIDLNDLSEGCYICKLFTRGEYSNSQKIILHK